MLLVPVTRPIFTAAGYAAGAVDFDGANDWLSAGAMSGAADGPRASGSFWLWTDTAAEYDILTSGTTSTNYGFYIDVYASGGAGLMGLSVQHRRPGLTTYRVRLWADDGAIVTNAWHNVMWSFDTTLAAGDCRLYVNDLEKQDEASRTFGAGDCDFTYPNHGVGDVAAGSGDFKLNGYLADFWYAPGVYLDFSQESNRRKFIDAAGKPVDLGADGSTPTGAAPLVFLAGATASWHTNKGTGGGFTENGALTDAPSSPSD